MLCHHSVATTASAPTDNDRRTVTIHVARINRSPQRCPSVKFYTKLFLHLGQCQKPGRICSRATPCHATFQAWPGRINSGPSLTARRISGGFGLAHRQRGARRVARTALIGQRWHVLLTGFDYRFHPTLFHGLPRSRCTARWGHPINDDIAPGFGL